MELTPIQWAKRAVTLKETVYQKRERRFKEAQEKYLQELEAARAKYAAMLLEEGAGRK